MGKKRTHQRFSHYNFNFLFSLNSKFSKEAFDDILARFDIWINSNVRHDDASLFPGGNNTWRNSAFIYSAGWRGGYRKKKEEKKSYKSELLDTVTFFFPFTTYTYSHSKFVT